MRPRCSSAYCVRVAECLATPPYRTTFYYCMAALYGNWGKVQKGGSGEPGSSLMPSINYLQFREVEFEATKGERCLAVVGPVH